MEANQDGQARAGGAVRLARPEETAQVAACLARAFETDPVARFLFPDDPTRLARLPAFYATAVEQLGPTARTYTDDGVRGTAVWQVPEPARPTPLRQIGQFLAIAGHLRSAAFRGLRLVTALEAAHPAQPYWYLSMLGTDPVHQGKGVGSAMIAPVLRECDATGVLAYLESSKEENIPFYRRHGFEVIGEVSVDDGALVVWSMLRAASGTGEPP